MLFIVIEITVLSIILDSLANLRLYEAFSFKQNYKECTRRTSLLNFFIPHQIHKRLRYLLEFPQILQIFIEIEFSLFNNLYLVNILN